MLGGIEVWPFTKLWPAEHMIACICPGEAYRYKNFCTYLQYIGSLGCSCCLFLTGPQLGHAALSPMHALFAEFTTHVQVTYWRMRSNHVQVMTQIKFPQVAFGDIGDLVALELYARFRVAGSRVAWQFCKENLMNILDIYISKRSPKHLNMSAHKIRHADTFSDGLERPVQVLEDANCTTIPVTLNIFSSSVFLRLDFVRDW